MKARLLIPLTVLLVGGLSVAHADFSTGFETTNGSYTAGSTIVGVDDNSAPGSNTWSALFGAATTGSMVITTTSPKSGSQALQINDTGGLAYAATVNLTNTVINFTQPYKVSFAMNILSLNTGISGNQIQFYFGAATTDPNGTSSGGRYWTSLLYNNGKMELYKNSTTGTSSTALISTTLSSYAPNATVTNSTTLSNIVTNTNGYVTFDITIDPVSKTYTGFQITSTEGVVTDFTSTVNGATLPWIPNSTSSGLVANADPAYNLMFVTGSDDITTVNFDNVSISNVPEPAAWALVAISALATFGYRCRRR